MAHHDFRRSLVSSASNTMIGIEILTTDHISVHDIDADAFIVLDYDAAKQLMEHLLDALDVLAHDRT